MNSNCGKKKLPLDSPAYEVLHLPSKIIHYALQVFYRTLQSFVFPLKIQRRLLIAVNVHLKSTKIIERK